MSNPFAPVAATAAQPPRHTTSSSSSNPFAEPPAPVGVSRSASTSARPASSSSSSSQQQQQQQQLRLTPLPKPTSSSSSTLKHVAVHHDQMLCVYDQTVKAKPQQGDAATTSTTTTTTLCRRQVHSAAQDGAVQCKERVHLLAANANFTLALVQLATSYQVFVCHPQDAVLKLRGPVLALPAPISCVRWIEDGEGEVVVLGLSNGQVKLVTGLLLPGGTPTQTLLCQLASPVVACLVREEEEQRRLVMFEQSGKVHSLPLAVNDASASSAKPRLEQDWAMELVQAVQDEDDAAVVWVLARSGLFKWTTTTSAGALQVYYAQDNCFAMSRTRLFLLVLAKQANKHYNSVHSKLAAVSRIASSSSPQVLTLVDDAHKPPSASSAAAATASALARDEHLGKTWLVDATAGLTLVEVANETKGAWRTYLQRATTTRDFLLALDYSSNRQSRDAVFTAYAEWEYARQNWVRSAELFAEIHTGKSFEEIALKFSSSSSSSSLQLKPALRVFLTGRLSRLQQREDDDDDGTHATSSKKALKVMLAVWICEVSLEEISLLEQDQQQQQVLLETFSTFLGLHAWVLEPARDIVFHLLQSHGRTDMLLVYAHLTHDYDRVIAHHVAQKAWRAAVLALEDFARGGGSAADELVYAHSPALIDHAPELLVERCWQRRAQQQQEEDDDEEEEEEEQVELDVERLLPALERVTTKDHAALPHVVRYLQRSLALLADDDADADADDDGPSSSFSQTVHNTALSIFALHPRDEAVLAAYVRQQANLATGPRFDHGLAVRVCEKASPKSRIALLDALNLPEAAVRVALDLGLQEHAQRIARMQAQTNYELGKHLWMLCCESAADGGFQAQLAVVEQSEGVLGMEDLLAILCTAADSSSSSSVLAGLSVDDVRKDVCAALERHEEEIEQLKRDMQEHTESAQALRRDANQEQQRFDVVRCGKHCDACGKRALKPSTSGDVFVFPCTHVFHSACLVGIVAGHLPSREHRDRVLRLHGNAHKTSEDQALLDEIIAASCPFCGELMIQSVSQPAIFARDEQEARSWD